MMLTRRREWGALLVFSGIALSLPLRHIRWIVLRLRNSVSTVSLRVRLAGYTPQPGTIWSGSVDSCLSLH